MVYKLTLPRRVVDRSPSRVPGGGGGREGACPPARSLRGPSREGADAADPRVQRARRELPRQRLHAGGVGVRGGRGGVPEALGPPLPVVARGVRRAGGA